MVVVVVLATSCCCSDQSGLKHKQEQVRIETRVWSVAFDTVSFAFLLYLIPEVKWSLLEGGGLNNNRRPDGRVEWGGVGWDGVEWGGGVRAV